MIAAWLGVAKLKIIVHSVLGYREYLAYNESITIRHGVNPIFKQFDINKTKFELNSLTMCQFNNKLYSEYKINSCTLNE
jgi:hypothetical protein